MCILFTCRNMLAVLKLNAIMCVMHKRLMMTGKMKIYMLVHTTEIHSKPFCCECVCVCEGRYGVGVGAESLPNLTPSMPKKDVKKKIHL